VWLGSTYGTPVGWSDALIVATVAFNSTSGTAQVQQGGAWSNSLPFNISTATISGISPDSGTAGPTVTITGSRFGAAQGGGQVWLGTAYGIVQSWPNFRTWRVSRELSLSESVRATQRSSPQGRGSATYFDVI